ncbi:MAG TPA: hypothetical protein VHM19_04170, partial [Polyangiales bacterium]|nr:hypothetical protein [Polyangiales bacterium]
MEGVDPDRAGGVGLHWPHSTTSAARLPISAGTARSAAIGPVTERFFAPVSRLATGHASRATSNGLETWPKLRAMPDSPSPRLRPTPPTPALVNEIVSRALIEDLSGGDLTTDATVASELTGLGVAISKSPLLACGSTVAQAVFAAVDPKLEFETLIPDGMWVPADRALWEVRGAARSILMAERTALNFVQHLSGIATLAHRFMREIPVGSSTRIADTRKTTPGLRALERYAVRAGGAHNHRDDVGSAILIKDNHIVASGGVAAAVLRARARAPHTSKIEI